MCGEVVDEGHQVCPDCEEKVNREHQRYLATKAAREAEEQHKEKWFGLFGRK